ncbi:MAG: aldo/keto reductase [Streptosporangiaceae bacterium]|nr:aldo/keto reductase [Streptosporangiaceae bacterium]
MTVGPADLRPLGRMGLRVSPVCIGTSPLASMPALYGYEVADDRAEETILAALRSPFNFMDTSNNYGGGTAERRIGRALAATGGLPPGFVLATKVDADPDTGDFSGERVKRSVAESLERLGLDRVPLMYLHDPEYHLTFAEAMARGGPVEALTALRDQGVLAHLGVAGGPVRLMREFIATDEFAAVLSHNRFTLVDRSAGPLMDDACQRGVAFVNGAPYGGGILAKGPGAQPKYAYRPAAAPIMDAVRAMQRACAAHGVSLAAAALQFSLRDPRVASTVVGVSVPSRIGEITALMTEQIPAGLWAELDSLAVAPELWLN